MTAEDLRGALARVAGVPSLLVASDYDGTLAPIVDRPDDAHPLPEAAAALRALAALPWTTAALISGRALRDLAALSRMPDEVQLVGSHGSEFDGGFVQPLDDAAHARLDQIHDALSGIAAQHPGVSIEVKPASVALHVRNARPDHADAALAKARAAAEAAEGEVTTGKAVLEIAVISMDKGEALDILRDRTGASAVVFVGDDVTDEKAFRRLHDPDVGIKVGSGDTLAEYRVDTPADVAAALKFLLAERRARLPESHPRTDPTR